MAVSLVIMAAGLGSRYGGSKQVDGIGPNGEILMEYSIHDALRAGFDKVVFIIKPEMREMMDELVGYLKEKKTAKGQPVQVAYVYQDYTSVPDFYHIPEGRTKPFGTVHALLCAEPEVDGPFCVINADDYYGVDAYHCQSPRHRVPGRLQGQGREAGHHSGGAEGPALSRRTPDGSGHRHGPGPGYGGLHELLGFHALDLPGAADLF